MRKQASAIVKTTYCAITVGIILVSGCRGDDDDDAIANDDVVDDDSADDDDTEVTEGWLDIASGKYNTCGIHEDDSLECFGYTDTEVVEPPEGEFIAVSCGTDHCIALDANGEAVSWGCYGEVWQDWCQNPDGPFVQVDAGHRVSCGLRSDGSAECWGNDEMEACDPLGEVVTKIDAYSDLTVGLREDGTILEWGPGFVEPNQYLTGNYKDVSIGGRATCVIKMDDSGECFGEVGMNGTFGDGAYQTVSTNDNQLCALTVDGGLFCPREYEDGIEMPTGTFQKVLAGFNYSCALSVEGSFKCFGGDEYGQSTFGTTHLWGGEVEPPPDSGTVCEENEPNDVEFYESPPWEEANDCEEMTSGLGQADSINGVLDTVVGGWEDGDTDSFRFVTSEEGFLLGSLEWSSAYTDLDWLLYCYYGDETNPWNWYSLAENYETAGGDKPAQGRSLLTLAAGTECAVVVTARYGDDMTEYTMKLWTES